MGDRIGSCQEFCEKGRNGNQRDKTIPSNSAGRQLGSYCLGHVIVAQLRLLTNRTLVTSVKVSRLLAHFGLNLLELLELTIESSRTFERLFHGSIILTEPVFQLQLEVILSLTLESFELGLTHNYARDQNVAGAGGFSAWQQAGPSWN